MEEDTKPFIQDDAWTYLDWSEAGLLEDRRIENEHRASKGDTERDFEDQLTDPEWLLLQWQDFLEDFDGILGEISSTRRYRVLMQNYIWHGPSLLCDELVARSAQEFIEQVFPTTEGLTVAGKYIPDLNCLVFNLSHPLSATSEWHLVTASGIEEEL